jgi:hydrogenase maturation protease
VLCLGNDILSDDALGVIVAERLRECPPRACEVTYTFAGGFGLLDHLVNARRLIVVDTMVTGQVDPGTVSLLREEDFRCAPGDSPHYVGLFEALEAGRGLELGTPEEVVIVAVEAADCLTIGGPMHPSVEAAVPAVVDLVRKLAGSPSLLPEAR